MDKEKLVFVTGNQNKLREAKEILSGFYIDNSGLDIDEIQGDAESVARDKVKKAFAILKRPCFVDDTSLECAALKGLPGVYIRDFMDRIGPEGMYDIIKGFEDHSAKAVCCIAYCHSEDIEPVVFRGEISGTLLSPRGSDKFNFDRIFCPRGNTRTFSEMTAEEKNGISHRKKALELFRAFLEKTEDNKRSF